MMHGNYMYDEFACSQYAGNMFGGWHILIMVGIIIVVIALVLFARKKYKGNDTQALNTLKMLYVNGDITEEEYLKRKSVIQG